MREPGEVVSAGFPRPGRTLKAVLAVVAIVAIAGAVIVNWAPGGATGTSIFEALTFDPRKPERLWTFVTSGILTSPSRFSHALWSLVGLYFLTTDLEKRWGGARMLRFLALGVVSGNLLVLAVSHLPIAALSNGVFRPSHVFGPLAAITATSMAWAKENPRSQIRLMFFLPISGKTLSWLTIGFAVLALIFMQESPEGAVAPVGGILAGMAFGGTPSPARSLWLRIKLALLRRKGHTLTVASITSPDRPSGRSTAAKRSAAKGGPPLRVVQGGLDDDLKNRKPPKDKRYLN